MDGIYRAASTASLRSSSVCPSPPTRHGHDAIGDATDSLRNAGQPSARREVERQESGVGEARQRRSRGIMTAPV